MKLIFYTNKLPHSTKHIFDFMKWWVLVKSIVKSTLNAFVYTDRGIV